MSSATDTYTLLRAFVQELTRCGMHHACTSPGSRCTPIVLSLAHEPNLRCHSHIDERCSGFFALGLAKATGVPVAVTCTSGTAAAELLPAVIEAHQARVPLIVLSADRPPELRENGAGQTIDQLKLYGDAAKWFFEVGVQEASERTLRWMRTLACRAYWTALEGPPGVVHLNFPLREPLIVNGPPPTEQTARPGGAAYVARPPARHTDPAQISALVGLIGNCERGVVVAGRLEQPAASVSAISEFCSRLSWPLLADPLSGARRGQAAIAHYDALLRQEGFAGSQQPDLVLRIGDLPTSKPLRSWLAGLSGTTQVALDPHGAWQDPDSTLTHCFALDPAIALNALEGETRRESQWLAGWLAADRLAGGAMIGELDAGGLSEPAVARSLGVLLPDEATLFVASSMPVRDIESFWPVREDPPRVLCNRGANGIDGTVSSAFGVAAAEFGPVVALIGDVALAHDIGGLLAATRLGLDLTIVLIDNDGGGIFDFLGIAANEMALAQDIFRTHISTPTGLRFERAAELYGLGHESVEDLPAFGASLKRALGQPGSRIIQVRTERERNVALHDGMWRAVKDALLDRPGTSGGAGPDGQPSK